MKRRLLAILLAMCLLVGMFPLAASAGGAPTDPTPNPDVCGEFADWSFDADNGILRITGTGDMYDYNFNGTYAPWVQYGKYDCHDQITSVIVEEGITSIGNFAFYYLPNLASISLPTSLETIGNSSFAAGSNATTLSSVTIPEGVTTIDNGAFEGLLKLESLTLPTTLKTIGHDAFRNAPLLPTLQLPEGLETVGDSAFWGCSSITELTLPSTLTSVGTYAFHDLAITNLSIPAALTFIGQSAFTNCENLANITVEEGNTAFKAENGVLYTKDGRSLVCYPLAKPETSFEIPKTVTSIPGIEYGAFRNYTNITFVTVENGNSQFTVIDGVLYENELTGSSWVPTNLVWAPGSVTGTIVIPKTVSSISTEETFTTSNITAFEVESGNGLYFAENGALYRRANSLSVSYDKNTGELTWTLNDDIQSLIRCPSSTEGSFSISQGTKNVYDKAFFGCESIISISYPQEYPFSMDSTFNFHQHLRFCTALKEINVAEGNTDAASVNGCIYTKDKSTLFYCPMAIPFISVADGTTSIGHSAWVYCTNLEYIIIPASVTDISWNGVSAADDRSIYIYGEKGSAAETLAKMIYYIFRAGLPEDYVLEPDWTKVTAKASVPYGTTNAGMVTIPSTGTATDGETTVSGKFEVLNASTVQLVGNREVTVQFTVTTDGDYKETVFTKDYSVTVVPKSISTCTISNISALPYNGSSHSPKPVVKDGNTTLIEGTDYTVLYSNNINVGTAAVTITGEGNYVDAVVKNFTITKAAITGYQTAAPTATILANNANNAANKLKAALNLPANVTVTYAGGTATLPITWANATEKFNAKGGTYTFKGTIPESQNFKAYSTPLTATLTVKPVTGTLAAALPASVVVAKSQAANAASYADFKLPSSITINCDNGVAAQTVIPEWSVPLSTLKAKRAGSKTTVKVTNVPKWLTMDELSVEVQVTDKFPVKVTVTQANGAYGTELAAPVAVQSADGNGTDPNGAFTYKYTGKTAAGKTYNSSEKPTEAGNYTVTATLVSDTHAGSGSADFTIAPKALTNAMIGAIDPVTYTGSAQTPALTVTDGKTLVKNTDYTVEYTNNINAGTATATVTGKGNYTGTASASFTIQPKDISGLTVTITGTPEVDQALLLTVSGTEASGLTYAWTADGGAVAGQTKPYLILTGAYENKQIAATVTGSGNYTGTASSQAVTVGASTNESTSEAVPAKPEVSAKAGNKQISVSVSVPTEETDKPVCLYEIQLCDSNGALLETCYSLDSSYTVKGLTNGTAYQVKVIAYNVNGPSAQSEAVTATPKASAPAPGPVDPAPTIPDPAVTENPDGSTTTTETAEDGTVTATTTWDDGKQAVSVKTPEGETTISVTTAAGEKVAEVKLPAKPDKGKAFEDVEDGAWYENAVNTATGYGLFNGTSDTEFSPNDGMTRGMLATVLYNLSGKPAYGTGAGTFNDVEAGKWYEDPVDWAYKTGVASGTGGGEFSPNKDITREQLVTMLYNYAEKIGAASSRRQSIAGFPDGNKVSRYAQDAMEWAVAEGFISGRASGGKNYIAPQGTATRAEVAAVLTRFVEYLKK